MKYTAVERESVNNLVVVASLVLWETQVQTYSQINIYTKPPTEDTKKLYHRIGSILGIIII